MPFDKLCSKMSTAKIQHGRNVYTNFLAQKNHQKKICLSSNLSDFERESSVLNKEIAIPHSTLKLEAVNDVIVTGSDFLPKHFINNSTALYVVVVVAATAKY